MRLSHFSISYIAILVGIIALTLAVSWNGIAQNGQSSLSGRVVDTDGNPVSRLGLAVKPVEINMGQEIGSLAPLESWQRAITDEEGRFSISNIDPVSSRLVMFPEHGSRFEIVSVQIGDLTFRYYEVSGVGFPPWLGQLTFSIEPGTSLEDVVVKVEPPAMRIRGRVLLKDRTPLANTRIDLTLRDRRLRYEGFFPFRRVTGGSSGTSRNHTWTDAQGYFVTYNIRGAKEYSVVVGYEGVSAESRWVHLEKGKRYDKFVLRLNDLDEYRENRSKREKARQAVWMVNPENDHAYKKITCDSWEDAKAKSETEGAYLVAINDAAEQKWLEAVYPEKAFFWIGLRVPEKAAWWQWDSGEPLTYVNWGAAGRPDDSTTDGVGEIPIALIFVSKKWMAIDTNSRLRPAVKYAILEREHY